MIEVLLNGQVVGNYPMSDYYADPSGGRLNIRLYAGDEIAYVYEAGEWDDVRHD